MEKQQTLGMGIRFFITILSISLVSSCGSDGGDDDDKDPEPEPEETTITVTPTDVKQEMIGFGGALTWYSTWVTNNTNKDAIADLMFDDLGIDIIRFKNWYYPDNYPTTKTTAAMSDDGSLAHWNTTNELYTMAMERNSDIKILLSSWGPPAALKSNNSTRATTGSNTLKKNASSEFMYDEFAQYWSDVLDYVPFDPDYISIQNEPTYSNTGWTTCQWAAAETTSLPSYVTAFDKVYDKIKNREHVPVMLGPESQDISTFVSFANALKNNPNCGMYGFHPYNINGGTSLSAITSGLQSVGNFNTKPNIMTEFSDNLDWFNTALFIHNSLVYANTSAYIYWKLAWNTPASGEDAGMISMNSSAAGSDYEVTPYYYLIKHYAKYVDAGYHRVGATVSDNPLIYSSAFLSEDGDQLTLVIINNSTVADDVTVAATGKTATAIQVYQSKSGSYYKPVTVSSPTAAISLPAKSITTVVLSI